MKTTLCILFATLLAIPFVQAQSFNYEITNKKGVSSLLGKINKEGLSSGSYASWFQKNYEAYSPKPEAIEPLKEDLSSYTITAFMGTWCGDSKREVPEFYKVLEASEFSLDRFTLVAVSREADAYKQSPGGEEEGLNIHRVPTFIVYKDGKEVNRIVESPVVSLEEDLVQILRNDYTSNYLAVTLVDEVLNEMGVKKFSKKTKKLLPKIQAISKNMYELNTYAGILFRTNRKEEGIEVARFNTLLYPNEAYTFVSLAHKLKQQGNVPMALKNYEKALVLDAENAQAKSGVTQLKEAAMAKK